MSRRGRFHALLTGAVFLLAMGGAVAEGAKGAQDINATLSAIKAKAATANAAGTGQATAKQAFLDAVRQAVSQTSDTGDIARIIAAAAAAAPAYVEEITSTAVAAAPSAAATIVGTAVKVVPSKSVEITVAALDVAPGYAPVIINSALRAAPRDSKTLSELQSLGTRPQNAITHDNNMPSQTPPAAGGNNTASPT